MSKKIKCGCTGKDCPKCNGTGWKRKTPKDRLKHQQEVLNPRETKNA